MTTGAAAIGRGRLHSIIRAGSKFDILLWWAYGSPRAPIEVKCQVASVEKIRADLQRIEKVICRNKKDSSFQFGMMVIYTSCRSSNGFSATEILKKRLENINADCRKAVASCTVKMTNSIIYKDGDSAWSASAIVLKPDTK